MTPDQLLVLGLFLACCAVLALFSAYADSRRPYIGGGLAVAALAVLLHGNTSAPGGYAFQDVPDAVYGVIADVVR
ncbi:hypothetical protein KUV62_05575 [Salipiger bermudensis]|uniref:hypothetical protein n=1 Tax=Salipiger bermudensis TaxID=344736 RepID=UPI001C992648|nr:hypothetical protein [Salipiger bermudensis]MBY6003366.1 hypothetical protein [Salipiger bermudensis]